MTRGSIAALPNLRHAIGDEELSPAPPPPVDPPVPPDPDPPGEDGDYIIAANGARYPADMLYLPAYSGSNTWNPNASSHGSAFTYTSGSWEAASGRNPTPGDQARLQFDGGTTLYAGRIDATDRFEMNRADIGYDGRPEQNNVMIITGVPVKDGAFDPAVFPAENGPHRHSMATAAASFWNETNLKGSLGGNPNPASDLSNPFLQNVMERSASGFGLKSGMLMYWPTFTDGIPNNGARHSGYIGRPRSRGIALSGLAFYDGDVVPPPFGLRMASFKADYFVAGGQDEWEFVVAFPSCWDGVNEWLPGGAHMAFLNSDGTPPATHPYVIPQIHWFVTVDRLRSSKSQQQMRDTAQSAQVLNNSFWNYSNQFVTTHAEIMLCWDPIFAEAMAWMVNVRAGLGRVNDTTSGASSGGI